MTLAAFCFDCKSTHAGKETLNACIPARAAKDELYKFVEKSHGSDSEDLVRSIAWSCIGGGLRACGKGCITLPVPYNMVAQYIQEECPDMEFVNDSWMPEMKKHLVMKRTKQRTRIQIILNRHTIVRSKKLGNLP